MNEQTDSKELPLPPSYEALCLEVPLYQVISIDPARDETWVAKLKFHEFQFDCYCTGCKREATFQTARQESKTTGYLRARHEQLHSQVLESTQTLDKGRYYSAHLACTRNGHIYSFIFYIGKSIVIKIGQFPSIEDVAGHEIERYRKILGEDRFAELRRAGGLISHGVGIGAFVYLRRVFEGLVDDAQKAADPEGKRAAEFRDLRMNERIKELAEHLPQEVVENAAVYTILSTGVHDLSEDECKRYYPAVRAAVVSMLEEAYEADQRKKAKSDLQAAVAKVAQQIAGGGSGDQSAQGNGD